MPDGTLDLLPRSQIWSNATQDRLAEHEFGEAERRRRKYHHEVQRRYWLLISMSSDHQHQEVFTPLAADLRIT
jgi:hypothetical protein